MCDFCFIGRANWRILQKGSSVIPYKKGMIDRVHDAVGSHHLERELERGKRKHPAGSGIRLLQEVVRDRSLQLFCDRGEHLIKASQVVRDHFSPMAQNKLQAGIEIEDATQNHAQRVDTRLHMPSPPIGCKACADNRIKACVVALPHGFDWRGRMQVNGNIKGDGCFENRTKRWIVQKVLIGRPIDQYAFKPKGVGKVAKPTNRLGWAVIAAAS